MPTPRRPITFCSHCDILLLPEAAACPICERPRPVEEAIRPAWPPLQLDSVPVAAPLRLGETLFIATNRLDGHRVPRQGLLYRLTLAGSHHLSPLEFPAGQIITGTRAVTFQNSVGAGLVLTTASADPVGNLGAVLVFDATGRELWRWQPASHTVSAPAVADNTVWVVVNQELVGLSLSDGLPYTRLVLDFPPQRELAPLLYQELAIIQSGRQLIGLEVTTGQQRWQTDLPPRKPYRFAGSTADDQRLYLGGSEGVYAFNLHSGQLTWHFPTKRTIRAVSVAAGVVYAAGHDRQLYALDADSGKLLWQVQAAVERVELAPPLILAEPPLAVVVDRKGNVTALPLPLTPQQQEAAGRWLEAADGYATQEHFVHAAELYEHHEKPYRAAQLWAMLKRPLRQAAALALYAPSLPEPDAANIWTEAAQLYKAEGEIERAAHCQYEVARCLKLPLLKIEIQTKDNKTLVQFGWSSHVWLVVQNYGFGPAQMVSVRVTEKEQFEGLITRTRKIARVPAGSSEAWTVDVRPLGFGDVPLRLSLDYQDQIGQNYSNELTLYLAVDGPESNQHPVQHVTVQVGGVHISNVVNSRLDLGDITASVQAGGDIIGNI
ncbi:MAG: PQQ-like beta-propeller repeat protein [Anaerolineae bacterium]|nr:PQQ-like beta-propeller repeat protein [Anaerolineae bacterium]